MGRLTVLADEYLIQDFEEEEGESGSRSSGRWKHHHVHYSSGAVPPLAAEEYRCSPPPVFIISVTLLELSTFVYYTLLTSTLSTSGPLPIDSLLVFRPDKHFELHRYVTYALLHSGWLHLMFNLLVQLLVGLPLEMVHGPLRIGAVYIAGVLAGSLGASVLDPNVYLVGASGGVYALLAAHLANTLLNYKKMESGLLRLLAILFIASVDVGFAVYDRYAMASSVLKSDGSLMEEIQDEELLPSVSYVAHLTGALAGLSVGILVLKHFHEEGTRERMLRWGAMGVYGSCMVFGVLFNVVRG